MSQLYRLYFLTFLTLVCVTDAALAKEEAYYTWVDENGVVNYSERDPKNQNAVLVSPSNTRFGYRSLPERPSDNNNQQASLPTGQSTTTDNEQASPEADAEMQAERDQVQQAIAKVKASNCQAGRRNLARLEAYARIRVKNSDGTERILTDEEKQAKMNDAKKTISENCSGG